MRTVGVTERSRDRVGRMREALEGMAGSFLGFKFGLVGAFVPPFSKYQSGVRGPRGDF
jgi:hypothetical protein